MSNGLGQIDKPSNLWTGLSDEVSKRFYHDGFVQLCHQ